MNCTDEPNKRRRRSFSECALLFGECSKKNNLKIKTDEFFLHLFSCWHTQTALELCCSFSLVCLRLLVVLTDLEVTQLIRLLVGRHHSQPVTEVVLLQVLLCQVLQIPGEGSEGVSSPLICPTESTWTPTVQLYNHNLPFVFNVKDSFKSFVPANLLENCFSDVTLILFFMRPTWTMLPRFPVFPFTLILSLRKVSYWTEHSDVLGKRTLVNLELGKVALVQTPGQLLDH